MLGVGLANKYHPNLDDKKHPLYPNLEDNKYPFLDVNQYHPNLEDKKHPFLDENVRSINIQKWKQNIPPAACSISTHAAYSNSSSVLREVF